MGYLQLFLLGAPLLLAVSSFPAALVRALREENPSTRMRDTLWACASFGLFALAVLIAAFR